MAAPAARLPRLTALRFPAALLVVVFHASVAPGRPQWAEPILRLGPGAVTFFFVLSGFVLTWSAQGAPPDTRGFYGRRAARIWPAHLVVLALAVGVDLLRDAPTSAPPVVAQAALVQSWWPVRTFVDRASIVSWSLACEIAFYAAFPVLHRLLPRRAGGLAGVVVGALAVGWAIRIVGAAIGGKALLYALVVFPPARVPEFVAGMALAALVATGGSWPARLAAVPAPVLVVVGLAAVWPTGSVGAPWINGIIAFAPSVLVLAWAAARDLEGRPTPTAARPWQWLGAASFCLYLVHLPLLFALQDVDGLLQPDGIVRRAIPRILVLTCLAIPLAGLVHEVVERPAERWLRRRIEGDRGGDRSRVPASTTAL